LEGKLKSVSIRNVPDDVYTKLKAMAKANRRSLQEQIKYLLEKEVKLDRGSSMVKAYQWRSRLRDREFVDTVATVREDRDR
jgi:predicted CopG family antitoxin